jgi:hypothetical protein
MKKIGLTLIAVIALIHFSKAQSNTFPATGNVGIGTTETNIGLDIQVDHGKADGGFFPVYELKTNESFNNGPFKLEFDFIGGSTLASRAYSLNTSDHGIAWEVI